MLFKNVYHRILWKTLKAKSKLYSYDFTFRWPGYKHKFYLRPSSSDIKVFYEVVYKSNYDLGISVTPKLIIDAGANTGFTSVYFAQRYPFAQIVALEPNRNNFNLMSKNILSYKNIIAKRCALWSSNTNSLTIKNPSADYWAFRVDDMKNQSSSEFVDGVTVDSVMRTSGVNKVDVLKMDIEGAEKEIFEKDDCRWLGDVRILIVELHDRYVPGCTKALMQALIHYNFDLYKNSTNLFFLNRDFKL